MKVESSDAGPGLSYRGARIVLINGLLTMRLGRFHDLRSYENVSLSSSIVVNAFGSYLLVLAQVKTSTNDQRARRDHEIG